MSDLERIELSYRAVLDYCDKNGYKLLSDKSEIKNNNSVLKIECPIHGVQEKTITSMKQGKRCYSCSRHTALMKKGETTQKDRSMSLYNRAIVVSKERGYDFLSTPEEIKKNISEIQYRCPKHGIHTMRVSNYLNGRGCPDCNEDKKQTRYSLSSDEVVKRIEDSGGTIINSDDYINNTTKNLVVLCPNCGEQFVTSLRNFCQHNGQVCNNCSNHNMSIGELKIKQYLDSNKYNYEYQKWFDDCRDINPLPFDFYLPEYNVVIEYDGEQHYKDRGYKTGLFSDTLEYTQKHDAIKTKYCEDNNIKLFRIPYYHKDKIEHLLNKYLHEDIV